MSRTFPEVQRRSGVSSSSSSIVPVPEANDSNARFLRPPWSGWNFWFARVFLAVCVAALCYRMGPFGLRGLSAAGLGLVMALVILLAELRLRRAAIGGLVGGAFGAVLGVFTALLVTLIISPTSPPHPPHPFLAFLPLSTS